MKYTLLLMVLISISVFALNKIFITLEPSPIYKVGDCVQSLTYKKESWESKYSSYPRRILEVGKDKYRYEFFVEYRWLTTTDSSISFNIAQSNSEKVTCPK